MRTIAPVATIVAAALIVSGTAGCAAFAPADRQPSTGLPPDDFLGGSGVDRGRDLEAEYHGDGRTSLEQSDFLAGGSGR